MCKGIPLKDQFKMFESSFKKGGIFISELQDTDLFKKYNLD